MGIYCLDPRRIAISGKVRVFAMDKTGTLTQPWLDFLGLQPVHPSTSGTPPCTTSKVFQIRWTNAAVGPGRVLKFEHPCCAC